MASSSARALYQDRHLGKEPYSERCQEEVTPETGEHELWIRDASVCCLLSSDEQKDKDSFVDQQQQMLNGGKSFMNCLTQLSSSEILTQNQHPTLKVSTDYD